MTAVLKRKTNGKSSTNGHETKKKKAKKQIVNEEEQDLETAYFESEQAYHSTVTRMKVSYFFFSIEHGYLKDHLCLEMKELSTRCSFSFLRSMHCWTKWRWKKVNVLKSIDSLRRFPVNSDRFLKARCDRWVVLSEWFIPLNWSNCLVVIHDAGLVEEIRFNNTIRVL